MNLKYLLKYLVIINICFLSQASKSTTTLCDTLEQGVVSLGKKQSKLEVSQGRSLEAANAEIDIITAKIAILEALQKLKDSKFPDDQDQLNRLLETTNAQVTEVFRRRHSNMNANQYAEFMGQAQIAQTSMESDTFHLQNFITENSAQSCTNLFDNISSLNKDHKCLSDGLIGFSSKNLRELRTKQKVLKRELSNFAKSSGDFQDFEKLKYLSISRMRQLECRNRDDQLFLNPYLGADCFSYTINNSADKSLDNLVGEMQKIQERALAENYYQDLGLGDIQKYMSDSQAWKTLKSKYCSEENNLIHKSVCSTVALRITEIDIHESPKKTKLGTYTTRYWNEDRQAMDELEQHPSTIFSYAAKYAASTLAPSYLNDYLQYRNFKAQIPFWESAITQQINMTNYFTQRLNSCQDSQQMWCNPYLGSYSIYTPGGFNFSPTDP